MVTVGCFLKQEVQGRLLTRAFLPGEAKCGRGEKESAFCKRSLLELPVWRVRRADIGHRASAYTDAADCGADWTIASVTAWHKQRTSDEEVNICFFVLFSFKGMMIYTIWNSSKQKTSLPDYWQKKQIPSISNVAFQSYLHRSSPPLLIELTCGNLRN